MIVRRHRTSPSRRKRGESPAISRSARILLLSILGCVSAAEVCGQSAVPPPTMVSVGDHHFHVADGYSLEQVAGSDLVPRPIVADLDDHGRLFVADSSGTNDRVEDQLRDKPHRIMCLQDHDGDGRYDDSHVFADRMMFPAGVLCHAGSVFVSAPPQIWRLTDYDHDGVADERTVWFDAKTLTYCANDLHGPYLGPDGWIYWCKGAFAEQTHQLTTGRSITSSAAHIFRRRVEGGPVEIVMSGGMDNPVEVAFSAEGERFFTTTFLQHPGGGRRDGLVHAIYGGLYGKSHGVLDGHPRTGPDLMPVMTHLGPAAPSGLTRLSSADGCGETGDLVSTAFNLHQVLRHQLRAHGSTYRTTEVVLVESADLDFHPTDCFEDADGSLLIIDTGGWYKLCCPTSQLHKPDVLGAIYRLRRTASRPPADPYGFQVDWDAPSDALAPVLGDPRPRVRARTIDVLSKRGKSAVGELARLRESSDNPIARQNAIWALCRIDGTQARRATAEGLEDTHESVQHAALHAVSIHRDGDAFDRVVKLLSHSSLAIRRVASETLGRIGNARAIQPLAEQSSYAGDRELHHALTYAMFEVGDVAALLHVWQSQPTAAVLIAIDQLAPDRLDAASVAPHLTSADPALADAAAWITSKRPAWQASAWGQLAKQLEQNQPIAASLLKCLVTFAKSPETQRQLAELLPRNPTVVLSILTQANCPQLQPSLQRAIGEVLAANAQQPEFIAHVMSALVAADKPFDAASPLHTCVSNLVEHAELPLAVRLTAVECLQKSGVAVPDTVFDWLVKAAFAAEDSNDRRTAANALATVKLPRAQLMALIEQLGDVGPLELPELLETLRASDETDVAMAAIDRLRQTPSLAAVPPAIVRDVFAHFGPETTARINTLLASVQSTVGEDASRLEQTLQTLPEGDVRRGQAVFHSAKAACFSCHQVGYRGGDIGPDLTRIGKIRAKRDLLEAIMFPSASFVRSFEPVVITTDNGQVISGVLRDETEHELVLFDGQAKPRRVTVEAIESRTRGEISIMPSGLDQLLSDQELADVIAFLQTCN